MDVLTLLPLVLIGAVFYFLILRPAKQRQRQQQETLNAVRVGDRIMTTAGLFGTVVDVTDDEIGLEIAPGVVVRYVKAAVAKVVVREDETVTLDRVPAADAPVPVEAPLAGEPGIGDPAGPRDQAGNVAGVRDAAGPQA